MAETVRSEVEPSKAPGENPGAYSRKVSRAAPQILAPESFAFILLNLSKQVTATAALLNILSGAA